MDHVPNTWSHDSTNTQDGQVQGQRHPVHIYNNNPLPHHSDQNTPLTMEHVPNTWSHDYTNTQDAHVQNDNLNTILLSELLLSEPSYGIWDY